MKRIKPMGRSVHAKSMYYYLLSFVLWVFMLGFLAVVAVEWAAGCGETYTDAQGETHQYECVFFKRKE